MSRFNRIRWFVAVPLFAAATFSLTAATKPQSVCAATAAVQWVQAHHDNLPTTLAELGKYSLATRKAILVHLPVPTQVELWREHMNVYLAPTSPLTPAQRDFVRDVQSKLPQYITGGDDARGRAAIERDSVTQRARRILGVELGAAIMTTASFSAEQLSAVEATQESGPFVREVESIAQKFGIGGDFGRCTCAPDSDWCLGSRCRFQDPPCVVPIISCGTLGAYYCEGQCTG